MKSQVLAFLAGTALTAAAMTGVTRAQESNSVTGKQACTVTVNAPQLISGTRCFNDDVQVGTWNNYLYCASLSVTCP